MKQAQIQNQDATCVICREGITNPICPECLARHIRHWKPGVSKILPEPTSEYSMETRCMFCGKEMGICAHCYSNDVDDAIAEEFPELTEEFRELFGLRKDFV